MKQMTKASLVTGAVVLGTALFGLVLGEIEIHTGAWWIGYVIMILVVFGRLADLIMDIRKARQKRAAEQEQAKARLVNRQMRRHPEGTHNRDFGHPQGGLKKSNRVVPVHRG